MIAIRYFRLERQLKSDFGGCPWVKISAEVPKRSKKVFEWAHNFKQELKGYILDFVKQLKRPRSRPLSDELVAENIFLLLEGAQMMVTISKTRDALDDAKKLFYK